MNLEEAKINGIKNLKAIYAYPANVEAKDAKKYLAIRILYGDDKVLTYDYTSEHFHKFVSKIIKVYDEEKDKHNIVLYGEDSKKLVDNKLINLEEDLEASSTSSLDIFNLHSDVIKKYHGYLKDVFKLILIYLKNDENITIDSIQGRGKNYLVTYSDSNSSKTFSVQINMNSFDNNLRFKISFINGDLVDINGMINDNGATILSTFTLETNNKITGNILYELEDGDITRTLSTRDRIIHYDDEVSKVSLDETKNLKKYFSFLGLSIPKNIIKLDENTFILGERTSSDELYNSNLSSSFYEDDDLVYITLGEEVTLNSEIFPGQFLERNITKAVFKKIKVDFKDYIILEIETQNTYGMKIHEYKVIEANLISDSINEMVKIEDEPLDFGDIKRYIKRSFGK